MFMWERDINKTLARPAYQTAFISGMMFLFVIGAMTFYVDRRRMLYKNTNFHKLFPICVYKF
jgi:hypothetical protein